MQLYMHVYGRKGTWRPTIPVQRSKQLCYRLQLSSFNREFMYIYCTTVMQCKQGSNFIAAIAVEGEQNAVDHCGNDGNFCRMVQFLYYSLCNYIDTWIQMLIKSCVNHYFSLSFLRKKNTLKKYVDMFLACHKSKVTIKSNVKGLPL
jgi:hypothetical protein